ncbi:hypothetical protein [Pseudonocardia sp.]|uniref:hypothetical protein n=1 Tax=Pseudonocardia sp. TaxID=60912 RepID=UPI002625A982|nr:hypothetical protein [Pseudonocardia sp.]
MTDTTTGTRPLAVVNGASSGIGYELAKQFAGHGFDLLVTAEDELKDTGVTVTSLMPGPTETDFHRADMDDTKVGASDKDDPTQVAAQGFEALMNGEREVVAGSLSTKASGAANAVLPDAAKAQVHRTMAEPGSAER